MNPENNNDSSNDRNNDVLFVVAAISGTIFALVAAILVTIFPLVAAISGTIFALVGGLIHFQEMDRLEERINILERENQMLKTELNLSNGKKDETVGFDSLCDDMLDKILEFCGKNSYRQFGSIDRRCRNMFDMEEYKLKKQTCVYAYGTLDMIVGQYLPNLRDGIFSDEKKTAITGIIFWYNRLDVVDWIIQRGDSLLFNRLCHSAAHHGRIDILNRVLSKFNLTMLKQLEPHDERNLCQQAIFSLKWLRTHGAKLDASVFGRLS